MFNSYTYVMSIITYLVGKKLYFRLFILFLTYKNRLFVYRVFARKQGLGGTVLLLICYCFPSCVGYAFLPLLPPEI
jgi:hypothetical protein